MTDILRYFGIFDGYFRQLRITGLPADWDDDILKEEFEGWEVTECKVVGNGVGFVTFEHKEEMEEVITSRCFDTF